MVSLWVLGQGASGTPSCAIILCYPPPISPTSFVCSSGILKALYGGAS